MLDMLRELILDGQEMPVGAGVPRRLETTAVPGKATVCIGVRRSGKSTYMLQLMNELVTAGVARENILYLNFFDDRLHPLRHGDLGVVAEAYFSLYPDKKNSETVHCFFDEVQVLTNWEPFVDRLMRTENCQVYITGSSAQMLSKEIATQMRGRALSWEIFPFSFTEFLDYHTIGHDRLSTKSRLAIQKGFERFWEAGGFPEVAGLDRRLRVKVHQEYLGTVLFRDLVERHDVSHPQAVVDLTHRLIDNVASLQSVNSLTGYLKSLDHKISRTTVGEYLAWLEDAYFMFQVRLFDASLARSHANPKKVYCVDHALAVSTGSGILVNSGHLLENLVFVALRRTTADLFYYRTGSGKEVDFIYEAGDGRRLVQVCELMADPGIRSRELSALTEAMHEQGINQATVVTRNEDEEVKVAEGTVTLTPAWRFLLTHANGVASA